jgi:ClpX C4-type zinc finger
VDEASDQSGGDAYLYALRDEQAYLQTDDQTDDEKPAIIARPPPDPAQFKCWFCRKSHQQVQMLFGAEYPVRDPNNFANETLIFICDECVAKFAERLARSVPGAPQ